MDMIGFVKVNVQGVQGPGAMSAPGVKVGDRLLFGYAPNTPNVEQIISTDDEVQQQNTLNWSIQPPFDLIFLRGI